MRTSTSFVFLLGLVVAFTSLTRLVGISNRNQVVALDTGFSSKVSPCNASIYWEGRVSLRRTGSDCVAMYDWNAVTFYVKVSASKAGSLVVEIAAGGKSMWLPIGRNLFNFVNRWLVKVRDAVTNELLSQDKIELPAHDRIVNVTVATFKSPGVYIVSARKMNQPSLVIGSPLIIPNMITLRGLHTSDGVNISDEAWTGELRHLVFPSRRTIEIWGASDSSGFGADLHGSPSSNKENCEREVAEITNAYQNSDLAYGALLARRFGAELHMQAVAGIGAERNAEWTAWWFKSLIKWISALGLVSYVQPMPSYFGNTFGTGPADANDWKFNQWRPDVVLLMLGGNDKVCSSHDASVAMPADFSTVYAAVIANIFQRFKQVFHTPVVVSVCGFASQSEARFCNRNSACNAVSQAAVAFNTSFTQWASKNYYVEVPIGVVPDNATFGCAGHRTADGQRAVAEYLVPRIGHIMNWLPATDHDGARLFAGELLV